MHQAVVNAENPPIELGAWISAHSLNISSEGKVGVVPMCDELIRQFEDFTGIYHLPADVVRQRLEGES